MELEKAEIKVLGLTPLYIFYQVATAGISGSRINDLHIIRALEDGLHARDEMGESLFNMLKCHLHLFHRELLAQQQAQGSYDFSARLREAEAVLDKLGFNDPIRRSLREYADYVAAGAVFPDEEPDHAAMQAQAERVAAIFS